MGSFASGFKMGGDMYDSAQESKRQKVLDDRATTAYEQGQEDRQRAVGLRTQIDDAYARQRALNNGTIDGRTADFSGTSPSADAGPVMQDQMAPVTGLRAPGAPADSPAPGLVRTPATQRDRNNAAMNIANLKQDDRQIAELNAQQMVTDRKDGQRAYMTHVQSLANDPTKFEEYAKEMGPAIKAFSDFQGLPSSFNFDPKTRSIVETPYGTKDPKTGKTSYGAAREVSFESMAPYMLAYRNLVSDYGDPETAAAQMRTMSDGERAKRFDEAKLSIDSATKLSSASTQQQGVDQQGAYQRGSLAIQAANARNSGGGGGGGDKKPDPQLVAKLNDVVGQYQNETDSTKKAGLERLYNQIQGQIATGLGKPMQLKEGRSTGETDPTKYYGAVKAAVESGIYKTPQEAQMAVDAAYGRVAPSAGAVNPSLQKLNGGGGGAPSAVARPTATAPPAAQDNGIPSPPPQFRNIGLSRVVNPQFTQWQQTYGDAFSRQQAEESAASQEMLRGYNPYTQNRVR